MIKKMKENEHQEKEKDHESVPIQMPLLFYFSYNKNFVQIVTYATIHGNQTI